MRPTIRSRLAILACTVGFWAWPTSGPAAEPVPQVALPLMTRSPTIDGVIGETEWRDAVRNVGFVGHDTRCVTHRDGVFWLGCDGQQLYIAVKTEAPPDGILLNRAMPAGDTDVQDAFRDDSLELVFDPKRGRTSGDRTFYHVIVNPRGTLYDRAVNPDKKPDPVIPAWRIPRWTFKNRIVGRWWHVEIAIPLTSLGATRDDLQHPWGVRIARNWQRPTQQSQWESASVSYENQASMPVVAWTPDAPVVRVLSLHDKREQTRIHIAVRNPHTKPIRVKATLSDTWEHNMPTVLEKTLAIAAGGQQQLSMPAPDNGPEGKHRTLIHVTSPDGRRTYYRRDYRWSLRRPKTVWTVRKSAKKKTVDLQFKYYPYHNQGRFRINVDALPQRKNVTGARAVIRRADGKKASPPIWQQQVTFKRFISEGTYAVPALADGTYELAVALTGTGVPTEPTTQRFVRKHFEWEHNKLGISDKVMPPFTPMAASGTTVRCVLREHEHGPAGLWRSVTTEGRKLLTAPMTWDVVTVGTDGKPLAQKVTGTGWRCLSRKPTGVVGEARWSAGAVRAHVRTDYDYDGMMLVTLTLDPTGDTSVHRLGLRIPVREREARYMHAVGESARYNPACFVPAGQGQVWDSREMRRVVIPPAFWPYLWIGGGSRGVCWFADSDRGMVLDPKAALLDLTRTGNTLAMGVHLITQPGPLARKHVITFGLQVTPTKPMPANWRRWTGLKAVPGAQPCGWLGTSWCWGGGFPFGVYPFDKRFEYYDELRKTRQTGKSDPVFVDKWMGVLAKCFPKGTKQHDKIRGAVRFGFRMSEICGWRDHWRLIGYTNPRGVSFYVPEFATFQDEWLCYRYFHRDWNPTGNVAYSLSPSRSFQDYAIWYYRKMLSCMEGVYFDCIFLAAHHDPVVGNAWIDDRGKTHPGMGLFHMRDLVKRTAIMHWQESKRYPASRQPFLLLMHMTNAQIAPVTSFGNCSMDWEWHYGKKDFQDRFTPEFIVAETIARQVGAWGTVLAGAGVHPNDPKAPWIARTRLGCCLVHEIQAFDMRSTVAKDVYTKLFAFGYGTPACRVFNYWDEGHPVSVHSDGVDARTLALACKGAAVIVVTDYGKGGRCEVTLDLRALGLKQDAVATNLENGEPIRRVAPGRFEFGLKKHDLLILHVR